MSPVFAMPAEGDAERLAALRNLEVSLDAMACAARLLAARPGSRRDAGIARALVAVLGRARRDLARLKRPSRSGPA